MKYPADIRYPSRWPSIAIVIAWIVFGVFLINWSDGATWSVAVAVLGFFLAVPVAVIFYHGRAADLAQESGLEPVFHANHHGNGSFFVGYRDPKTGRMVGFEEVEPDSSYDVDDD